LFSTNFTSSLSINATSLHGKFTRNENSQTVKALVLVDVSHIFLLTVI
jgi:hypothetical protein